MRTPAVIIDPQASEQRFGIDVLAGAGNSVFEDLRTEFDDLRTAFEDVRTLNAGLLTNDAARPSGHPDIPSRKFLIDAGFNIKRLFSPEHGIAAKAEDGAAVGDITDPVTGLKVVSLYGERLMPRPEDLRGLDLILYDIPDVGARFYTYNWTMSHMLEACAANHIPFHILDRPNPLGGTTFEGPMQDTADRENFLGRAIIPVRHGLTTGELARLLNREWNLGADLTVIAANGWHREMLHETGFRFHQPSPALQSYESLLLYPGLCLFEAVNMSVGRGTDSSFLQIGAPWLDPEAVLALVPRELAGGVEMVPALFTPGYRPWQGRECNGIRFRVTEPALVRPVALALGLMSAVFRVHRAEIEWTAYPTAANPDGENHFMRLAGNSTLKSALETEPETVAANAGIFTGPADWKQRINDIQIYRQPVR